MGLNEPDWAEAWTDFFGGGMVWQRFAADMVLAIEGGAGGAKANLTSFKFGPKTATQ